MSGHWKHEGKLYLDVNKFAVDTWHMSATEVGAYALLVMMYFHWDQRGLVNKDEVLSRIAKVDVHQWAEIKPIVLEKFILSEDRWHHPEGIRRKYITSETRAFVVDRDGQKCGYCGDLRGPFHLDHIIPVCKGGTNDPSNLKVACRGCNLSKGSLMPEEWRP